MSIELLATANEWALRLSLIILCFLSYILHIRIRKISSLLIFVGLIIVLLSILLSTISWEFLFRKRLSPQDWEKLVVIYNLSSILGYLSSIVGSILLVFYKKED